MVDHTRKTPYTWGLRKLDVALSKPDLQELIVVYGGAGTGKTEFTHFMSRANADNGIKVCYLSLEMPKEQLALRYAVKRAGIKNYIDFQEKRYTQQQGEAIDKYYKEFYNYPNIALVGEDREYTLDDLLRQDRSNVGIMQEYYDNGYKVFVIDNLGKIITGLDEFEAQNRITSSLQKWKNTNKALVFLVHHTSKAKKGSQSNMRGSQKIIDNATKVIRLERQTAEEYVSDKDKAELKLIQEKNSVGGEYAEVECYFDRGVYVEEFVGDLYKNKAIEVIDREGEAF